MNARAILQAAGVSLLLAQPAFSQGRPAGVVTDLVTEETVSETIAVFGELIAGRQSRVASRISGVADAVPVDVGDAVLTGDTLAEIDGDLLRLEVARAEADLTVAEAALNTSRIRVETAQTAFERAEMLRENSVIATAVFEERESALSVAEGARAEAEARVATARVALERARYDLDNAVVRAPFDGVVIDVGTEVGQFVSQGAEVAILVDVGHMEVEANVPARFVAALQKDQDVLGQTDAGGAMVLKLRAALPTEFSATRTRPVIFDVVSKEGSAAVGQSVTLNVPVSTPRSVAAVPKDALIQSRGAWQVFVAENGTARPATVEIGTALGDRYEVISGLSVGDAVVVRGNERLRPGQAITATPVGGNASGRASEGSEPGRRQQAAAQTPE